MSQFFRRPRLRPIAGAALLTVTLTGFAASPVAPPLTLTAVLQRVAERNPALIAEGYAERSAEALIEQAGVRPSPILGVTAENMLGTGAAQGVRRLEATAQASQTFERGEKRERRIALAESDRATASFALALQRSELLAGAAEAYVATLAAQERLALAQEPVDLARSMLAAIEAGVRDGTASAAQAARARAAVAAARVEHLRAQAVLDQARAALAATWGEDGSEGITVAGRLRLPDTAPAGHEAFGTPDFHPRLALQNATVAQREAALSLEEAESTQDITASGGLRFLSEGNDAAFLAGLSIPLPVRNRNQGSIRAARESVAGAEQHRRATEASLRAAVSAARRNLQATHAAASTLRREALPPTEEVAALVQRAHEAGESSVSEVLEAHRELAALRREILEAELAYATSLIRYEALVNPTYSQSMALLSIR